MAGGKYKKPQRGGGRNFSRRIEAVHAPKKQDVQSGLENLSEPESEHAPEAKDHSISESDSESTSEKEDEEPTMIPHPIIQVNNPNHLASISKRQKNKSLDMSSPIEMSRKEREAVEKEAARQKYWKLHLEGKTDQAKSDLARLTVIRKQREEAAAKRLAENKAKEDSIAAKIGLDPSMRF